MDTDYTKAKIDFAKQCLKQNDGNTTATAGRLSNRMPKDAEFSDLMRIVHTAQAQLSSDEDDEANTDDSTETEVKTTNDVGDAEVKESSASGEPTPLTDGDSKSDGSGSSEIKPESETDSSPDMNETSDPDEGGATSWSA
jgi:hypothetical protein